MHCFMCKNSDDKLHKFQGDKDDDTFIKIMFLFPERSIPESKEPVFICAACLGQVSLFYTIKKQCLQNCCRLKQFNAMLKGTNNIKCNELKVNIYSDELSTQHEHHVEIKVEPNPEDLFLSEDTDPTHVMTVYEYNDQQLGNDESSLNRLQDSGSSTEKHYSYVEKTDSGFTYNDEPKTQCERKDKLFKCRGCDKEFKHPSALERHSRVHSGEKPYKCSQCVKAFTQLHNLNNHILMHSSEKLHECDVCHEMFNKKSYLIIHKRSHKMERSNSYSNSTSNNILYNERPKTERGIEKKPYICNECHKVFKHRCDIERHIRVHTGERPYKCSTCEKTFTQSAHLSEHKHTHIGEKSYNCNVCQKTFSQKTHLIMHKREHNNVRPFQCSVCSKAFIKTSDLNRHNLIHTGKKPHECHLCEYKCAYPSDLKRHIRYHTGEKPFSCKHCEKSFITTRDLKVHERSHDSNKD